MLDKEQVLSDLTEEQRQAVTNTEGPLLVLAGAGSGKTRVITRRVAYLLGLGIPGPSIVAITFTNKAAGEMKARVSAMLKRPLREWGRIDQPDPIICTFHSLGLRILRAYAQTLQLPPNFSVYDTSDQERVLKEAAKAAEVSTTNFPISQLHSRISDAKNKLQTAETYASNAGDFNEKTTARVYKRYQLLLAHNNALDFDDLLLRTALAFRDHPPILAELQDRFQYVLIDEYQDTNHAQYIIAHALAQKHRNICVVGDPDQSIYAWRGADIRNILDFEKDYPDAMVVRLEQNYRSTQTILKIASQLIEHNSQRKRKTLWTENAVGEKATVLFCSNEHVEAMAVADRLRAIQKGGATWSQMAIFYRINALSRVMEDALRKAQIPYRIARGVDFYHRKEIKDVLAYLRVVANPADEVSLLRIINTPARGISEATVKHLQVQAIARGQGLGQCIQTAAELGLNARAQAAVETLCGLLGKWVGFAAQPSGAFKQGRVQSVMEEVLRSSGYEAYLKKVDDPDRSELANVAELVTSAVEYDAENPEGTLADYLARISLVSDVDALRDTGGAVTLMTLHAAKGLEFPVVAIIGMEEGILPHARVQQHPDQLEEERRLCFVGITRAQEKLLLSRAIRRMVRGQTERTAASQFFAELPPDALEVVDLSDTFGPDSDHDEPRFRTRFRRGQRVRHPRFGLGCIAELSNMGRDTRVIVQFEEAGRKTLILEHAGLAPA